MTETELDLLARITLHQFLLEQVFAKAMLSSGDPQGEWAHMSKGILHLCRFKMTAPADAPELHDLHERLVVHAERFCERVADRIAGE